MSNHTKEFKTLLKGKVITDVRRLTAEEMEQAMWYKNPVVLMFDDDSQLILQADDEGNDGGAATLYYGDKCEVLYTT